MPHVPSNHRPSGGWVVRPTLWERFQGQTPLRLTGQSPAVARRVAAQLWPRIQRAFSQRRLSLWSAWPEVARSGLNVGLPFGAWQVEASFSPTLWAIELSTQLSSIEPRLRAIQAQVQWVGPGQSRPCGLHWHLSADFPGPDGTSHCLSLAWQGRCDPETGGCHGQVAC